MPVRLTNETLDIGLQETRVLSNRFQDSFE